jgi:hypothetical protein
MERIQPVKTKAPSFIPRSPNWLLCGKRWVEVPRSSVEALHAGHDIHPLGPRVFLGTVFI